MNLDYKKENLFLKNIFDVKDIKKYYKKLKDEHHIIIYMCNKPISKYKGKFFSYVSNMCIGYDDSLQIYTNITDYYVDDVRFLCSKLNLPNPIEQFYSDTDFESKYNEVIQEYNIKNPDESTNKIIMRKILKNIIKS